MEYKYDSYYKERIPYKETMKELHSSHDGYITERDLLAYIRNCNDGKDFRFIAEVDANKNPIITPLGAISDGTHMEKVLCKLVLVDDSSYNPLVEKDILRENHWYHPYKIEFTPVEFQGFIEKRYFSDFCSAIDRGNITLIEEEN
jgi:hypothetical protein